MNASFFDQAKDFFNEYAGKWQRHFTSFLPVISLLTDFGTSDTYIGQVKGAIFSVCRGARIIDLTHDIEPQNIRQAAFILPRAVRVFPENSIHVAIVDPGVGTERKIICAVTDVCVFLAPDNGLLSGVLKDSANCKIYSVTNDEYFRKPVSPVFHGRDIFAPVAGHLAAGLDPSELGPEIPLNEIKTIDLKEAVQDGNSVKGEIVFNDRFGNAVTNIHEHLYRDNAEKAVVILNGKEIGAVKKTFSDAEEGKAVAYTGSFDHLEIAVRNGSASEMINALQGSEVLIKL